MGIENVLKLRKKCVSYRPTAVLADFIWNVCLDDFNLDIERNFERILLPPVRPAPYKITKSRNHEITKLYYQTHSPYARKVLVFAHEVGLEGDIDIIHCETSPTRSNEEIYKLNPLGEFELAQIEKIETTPGHINDSLDFNLVHIGVLLPSALVS